MLISSDVLKSLPIVCARDNSRYGLANIQFTQEGDDCRATATDSKVLVSVAWKSQTNGLSSGALIPAKECKKLAKIADKGFPDLLLVDDGEKRAKATNRTETQIASVDKSDQRFPQWSDVIPWDYETFPSAVFPVDAFHRVLEAMSGASGGDGFTLYLNPTSRASVLVSRSSQANEERQALGVIMPLMVDDVRQPTNPETPRARNSSRWWRRDWRNASAPDVYYRRALAELGDYPIEWEQSDDFRSFRGSVNGFPFSEIVNDASAPALVISASHWIGGTERRYRLELPWDEIAEMFGALETGNNGEYLLSNEILTYAARALPFEGFEVTDDE